MANSPTLRALHHLISSNSPDIAFLSEPMTLSPPPPPPPQPHSLRSSLGFDGFFSNNPLSISSIWCLFKTNSKLNIALTDYSNQFLTISFANPVNGTKSPIFGIYASTNYVQRRTLWDYLSSKASSNISRCVLCDFNAILSTSEKLGLSLSRLNIDFQKMTVLSSIQATGFTGNKITWSNNHMGTSYEVAWLDNALHNHNWHSTTTDPLLSHLAKYSSDHCPILLSHYQLLFL